MALTINSPILADEIADIKSRLNAECTKRHYTNPVDAYAGAAY